MLEQYVFRMKTMGEILDDLGIGQALFFETKRDAIEMLASELWLAEQRAREEVHRIPQNIPAAPFDFIPRVDDQDRNLVELILRGLQNRPWVVSVRGYGGVGKSTLAIEAAWESARRGLFDRVAWVDIAPDQARSPELLGYILDTIGKRLGSRNVLAVDDVEERRQLVLALLAEARCLVVIDSTERVPDTQHQQIVQLVRDLPLPTCALIMSREMQRKTELETMIHLEGMQDDEALRFLEARTDEHHAHLDDQEARHLCRVTRGNPRAMLLALGLMTKYGLPAQDVLETDLPEMSDLLDHLLGRVYEKLDQTEERVLNVMPLFTEPVPWSPIAAASGLAAETTQVRAALGNLHSRFVVDVDGGRRYSIAPLTSMFLHDRAARPGARTVDQPAREYRSDAYGRLIDHCIEEFEGAGTYERLEYVRAYRQTIIDELSWAQNNSQNQRLTDLVFYTGGALGELGYWRDKLAWGESAIRAAESIGDRKRVAWHRVYDVGWTYIQRGNNEQAEESTTQGLREAQALNYEQAVCIALRNLGLLEMQRDQYETAVSYIQESVGIAEAQGIATCLALAKATLGEAKLRLGEPGSAQEFFEEALSIYQDMGNPSWQSIALSQIATSKLAQGDVSEASQYLDRAMALAQVIPEPSRAHARTLLVQGKLHLQQGRTDEALDFFRQSRDMYARLGQVLMVGEVQTELDALLIQAEQMNAN